MGDGTLQISKGRGQASGGANSPVAAAGLVWQACRISFKRNKILALRPAAVTLTVPSNERNLPRAIALVFNHSHALPHTSSATHS
jgi:hypothetical protein